MILGISGRRGAGKDTLAHHPDVIRAMGYIVEYLGFADPMKWFLADLYSVDVKAFRDERFKQQLIPGTQTTWRQALIYIGELMNGYGGTPFTDRAVAEMRFGSWIVMDVRRVNEVDAIHELGGKVVRLLRNPYGDTAVIESELDYYEGFDLVIPADATIEESARLTVELLKGGASA